MIDFLGKRIKVFLKNGATTEGILSLIHDNYLQLTSENTKNILLINNDKDNISFIKIFLNEEKVNSDINLIKEPLPPQLDHAEIDFQKRTEQLIQLKKEQSAILKQNIAKHIKSGMISKGRGESNYVAPDFTK